MRLAGPYIAAVGWRDRGWVQDLGLKGEGGPYTGPAPRVEPLVTQPDGSAIPGIPGAAAAGRGGGGGRGRGGRGGGRRGRRRRRGCGASGAAAGAAAARRSGQFRRRRQHRRRQSALQSLDGEMPKRPIGGKNAKGGGWSAPSVAMGTGVVHIPRVATVLARDRLQRPVGAAVRIPRPRRRRSRRGQDRPAAAVGHRHAEARRHHDPQVVRDGQLRACRSDRKGAAMLNRRLALLGAAAAIALRVLALDAQSPAADWPAVAGDVGGMKYPPANQITPANVAHADPGVDVSRRRARRRSSSTTSCTSPAAATSSR